MKKVLSLVLVIAMVLSSMSFAFGATFNDVADDNDYAEAVETLKALGVIDGYEDGSFKPEKTVTRAEMAKLMVVLLGYGDLVTGSKSNFSDTQGHWADSYIGLAAGRGIVVGTGDGKFNPERTVSYDEVLTMLVRGLGYTDSSNELKNMTWPTNFKVKAAELNITKNVAINSTGADRGGVAQAMFNSLDQQLVKVNSDGDIVKEFRTVGTRTDVPVNLISRVATLKDTVIGFEHITPGDKNYAGDKVDLTPYLFQTVEAYFNKNNDKEIVYVGEVQSITYTDTFEDKTGNDLEVGDYVFDANGTLVSYNNVEEKYVDLTNDNLEDAKITVVLNGDQTRVKDGAKVAGIIVEKANTYVQIEEEYKADATEIDEIYLPVKSKKVDSANLIVKGDATELSDIEKDDIVAVYAPLGKDATVKATDKLTLAVSRDTIEGKVTGTAKEAYYIDRTKYEVNFELNIGDLEVGDTGTFYLDDNGKIIAFKGESEGEKDYAVVDEVYEGRYEVTGTVGNEKATVIRAPKVKLHTASNETITYEFDLDLEKGAVVEGVQTWVVDDSKLGSVFKVGNPSGQFNEGKITFNNVSADELVSYSLDKSSNVTAIEKAGRTITMKTDSKSFVLASNAVIFNADGDVISESKLGSEVDGLAVYKNGKIVALFDKNSVELGTYYYAYINSVYKDTDEDGNQVQRINAYIQGKKNENLLTTKKDTISSTAKGLYVLDLNGNEVVQDEEMTANGSKVYKYADIASATTVTGITSGGNISLSGDAAGTERYFNTGSATIIKVLKDDSIEVVSRLSSIKAGDKVICFEDVKNVDDNNAVDPAEYISTEVGFIIVFEK